MTSTMMNIPSKINVGYQKRGDTYSGKLAYVVYTDAKGKLRKEKSWKTWCNDKIKKDIFDNVPTEGFVLNRGVGGQRESWGWNARNEYIRVYDPRGFEFEISVANLLFILQECSSIKGKGLEGEFVYSWDGVELVLLPCCSEEYKECVKFTNNQTAKITKGQMVEGCTYEMKNMSNVMYLGRHNWFVKEYIWSGGTGKYFLKPVGKKHIFWDLDDNKYVIKIGFTKLAKRTSDEAISDYADRYEKMKNSIHCMVPTKVVFKKLVCKKDSYYINAFIKKGDEYYSVYIYKDYRSSKGFSIKTSDESFVVPEIKDGCVDVRKSHIAERNTCSYKKEDKSLAELQKIELYKICLVNKKNNSYNLM